MSTATPTRITRTDSKLTLAGKDRGFTIIELLVVMAIIGLLVAIAIPVFSKLKNNAYDSAAQSDLRQAAMQIESQYTQAGTYPTSVRDNYYGGHTLSPTDMANIKMTSTTEVLHYGRSADGSGFAVGVEDERTHNAYCYDSILGGMQPVITGGGYTALNTCTDAGANQFS